jgi:RNA polymerase sigma factor (sigma-70 family)
VSQDCPETTDPDLSACLERVRQGDEAAIRTLITSMYPLIYKLVRSNLSRRGEEEDLVQTVLTKVFRNLDQFSGRVPFHHWVSRIAVNTCLNLIRYEKSRPEVRMADLSEDEATVVQNLAVEGAELDSSLGLAARDLVQHLVSCLRPKDRLLVRLIYLENLSYEETAEATGWSAPAIAMRISRAKVKMRARHEQLLKGEKP